MAPKHRTPWPLHATTRTRIPVPLTIQHGAPPGHGQGSPHFHPTPHCAKVWKQPPPTAACAPATQGLCTALLPGLLVGPHTQPPTYPLPADAAMCCSNARDATCLHHNPTHTRKPIGLVNVPCGPCTQPPATSAPERAHQTRCVRRLTLPRPPAALRRAPHQGCANSSAPATLYKTTTLHYSPGRVATPRGLLARRRRAGHPPHGARVPASV